MSFAKRLKQIFTGKQTENAVQSTEVLVVNIAPAEQKTTIFRKLKDFGKALKKPFVMLSNWRRSDSTESTTTTSSYDSDTDYSDLMEHIPLMKNYYRIKRSRKAVGLNSSWSVYDAVEIEDETKLASIFVFDKNKLEGDDKEIILNKIRQGIKFMRAQTLPFFLPIKHGLEEGDSFMAFATERVVGSLEHNFLSEDQTLDDIEIYFGIQQIIDSLMFLHFRKKIIFQNICPSNIIITKRGVWKLFGFELAQKVKLQLKNFKISQRVVTISPWSVRTSPYLQSELNYIAPEVLMKGECLPSSDVFSLSCVICAAFNNGHPIIEADQNPIIYIKRIRNLEQCLNEMTQLPGHLHGTLKRMLSLDPTGRPCTQTLARPCDSIEQDILITPEDRHIVSALQFAEELDTKSDDLKHLYFEVQLIDALPFIPENKNVLRQGTTSIENTPSRRYQRQIKKMCWSLVWTVLMTEIFKPDPLISILKPLSVISNNSSNKTFKKYVLPMIIRLLNEHKKKSSVYFLEHLNCLVTPNHHSIIIQYLVPILYSNLENQIHKKSSVIIMISLVEYIIQESCTMISVLTNLHKTLNSVESNLETNVLIFKFYELIVSSLDDNIIFKDILPDLLMYTYKHPFVFDHRVLAYSRTLSGPKFRTATRMFINQAEIGTISKIMDTRDFNTLIDILNAFVVYIRKSQHIIVTLIDTEDYLPQTDNTKSCIRTNNNTCYTQWLQENRNRRRITTPESHSMSEKASSVAELSMRVSTNYQHRFLRGFDRGIYVDYDGSKKKLPSWNFMEIPQATESDYCNVAKWARAVDRALNPPQ